MTTAAARWHEGGRSAGHHGAKALIASILAAVVLVLFPLPSDSPLSFVLPVVLFAFVVISWFAMRQHDRSLCESCLATMPLDAAATAARRHRRFATAHLGQRRGVTATYLVVLLGSNGLLFLDGLWPRVVWAAIQLTMVWLILAYATHRSLQPWCPWCSDGGGGQEVFDRPDPRPVDGQLV